MNPRCQQISHYSDHKTKNKKTVKKTCKSKLYEKLGFNKVVKEKQASKERMQQTQTNIDQQE